MVGVYVVNVLLGVVLLVGMVVPLEAVVAPYAMVVLDMHAVVSVDFALTALVLCTWGFVVDHQSLPSTRRYILHII